MEGGAEAATRLDQWCTVVTHLGRRRERCGLEVVVVADVLPSAFIRRAL